MHHIAILPSSNLYNTQSQKWAQQLGLSVISIDEANTFSFLLVVNELGLSLQQPNSRVNPIKVDFAEGVARHRRLYGGGRGQMLAKAVGAQDKANLRVVDATAGLGRDAFVLASLGCKLMLIERSLIISALLEDGLMRATQNQETALIISRMQLVKESAHDWLKQTQQVIDVVYLDPMFPESNKTALVKKEMRVFHELLGMDDDADGLLDLALAKSQYRVVVKRPRLAPPLANREPTYALKGKANRFDVYVVKSIKKL